ncbi:MAG: cupin domain-containing protein [Candidatus Sericytochromatia bacterium]|nr:cupin domain-containing protein [Candidatus Sericytochromatia bacterium]
MSQKEVIVTRLAERQPVNLFGERLSVLANSEQTGGMEVFFQEGSEGSGPPPHAHPWEEAFYVLSGKMTIVFPDLQQELELNPGDFVHIPADTFHGFQMTTETRLLSVTPRHGASGMFRDIAREFETEQVDMGRVLEAATPYGTRLHPLALSALMS